jgi:serine/threonine protein kinase
MPLKFGDAKRLIEITPQNDLYHVCDQVLRQMTLALCCVHSLGLVHRDVKPENILWEYDRNSQLFFTLCDFGLSNEPDVCRTIAGAEVFMSPEVFGRKRQTKKIDIWGLFATFVWSRDLKFRQKCLTMTTPECHEWISKAACDPNLNEIRNMGSMDPSQRPLAEQLRQILENWTLPAEPALNVEHQIDTDGTVRDGKQPDS